MNDLTAKEKALLRRVVSNNEIIFKKRVPQEAHTLHEKGYIVYFRDEEGGGAHVLHPKGRGHDFVEQEKQ